MLCWYLLALCGWMMAQSCFYARAGLDGKDYGKRIKFVVSRQIISRSYASQRRTLGWCCCFRDDNVSSYIVVKVDVVLVRVAVRRARLSPFGLATAAKAPTGLR